MAMSFKTQKSNADVRTRLRILIFFAIVALLFACLAFRIGWITVIASDKYAKLAQESQTRDLLIPARRGGIYDRNMT